MIDRALLVRIEAKEGKEDQVESFLKDALDAVREEDKTIDWFAVKFGKRDFAIFETFPTNPAGWPISPARSDAR